MAAIAVSLRNRLLDFKGLSAFSLFPPQGGIKGKVEGPFD
jgi:hypothetical protein